jgi:hypothetical protein
MPYEGSGITYSTCQLCRPLHQVEPMPKAYRYNAPRGMSDLITGNALAMQRLTQLSGPLNHGKAI